MSSGSGLGGSVGSSASGVTGDTIFSELLFSWTAAADASVAPVDSPPVGTQRWLRDAASRRFIWTYHGTDGWAGVEVTA